MRITITDAEFQRLIDSLTETGDNETIGMLLDQRRKHELSMQKKRGAFSKANEAKRLATARKFIPAFLHLKSHPTKKLTIQNVVELSKDYGDKKPLAYNTVKKYFDEAMKVQT